MKASPLADALCALAPGAAIRELRERAWHSATFSGRRMVFDLFWDASAMQVQAFAESLGDQEFGLRDLLVADIVVADWRRSRSRRGYYLTVEALVLDDEV